MSLLNYLYSFYRNIFSLCLILGSIFFYDFARGYEIVPGPGFTATDPSYLLQKEVLTNFIQIYLPPELVRKTGLEQIRLFKDPLMFGTEAVGGLADGHTISIHVLPWTLDEEITKCTNSAGLDLDCEIRFRDFRFWKMQTLKQTFSHELFHLLDNVLTSGNLNTDLNTRWRNLNPAGHEYKKNGLASIADSEVAPIPVIQVFQDITTYAPGFITQYAKEAFKEDKSETFGWYMVRSDNLISLAVSDATLQGKINLIKEMLDLFCSNNSCTRPETFRDR